MERRVRLDWRLILCGCLLGTPSVFAASKCKLGRIVELPITMNSLRPTIDTAINGKSAKFVLDSGAFYSMMSAATAAEYGLKIEPGPFGLRVQGIGGTTDARLTTVKEFSIVGVTIKNVEFLVGGSDVSNAGLLGQNLLEKFDVEYDLSHGAIRLFRTEDCEKTVLAYWLKPDQAFSMMPIDRIDAVDPHTIGVAYVNGQKIRVTFDTGAFQSVLSLKAAARAGVTPDSPGVVFVGYEHGIGRAMTKAYVAPFDTFKIGDNEEIKNTKLQIADIDLPNSDMLLGADFFVSHRIFVANKEHRLYLTYNGGPVFKLRPPAAAISAEAAPAAPSAADAPVPADARVPADTSANDAAPADGAASADAPAPADAAEWARRGSALAARLDFVPALADLTKAIELNPTEPEYYYERANAYWRSGQRDPALADYDKVIALKADFQAAYIPRAEIKLAEKDTAGAIADLDAVDRLAAKPAALRLELAELYAQVDRLPDAIQQFSLWIDAHPDDSKMLRARAGRCYNSALQNQDLSRALGDCNAALRLGDKTGPNYAALYVDRGLVRLRLGDYPKAIEDFDAALKLNPNRALAWYAKAVAEARTNQRSASDADLQAAEKIAPKIADQFGRYGLTP